MTLVILNHMWPWESYSRTLFLFLQLPWMLMDTFFVMSGFLITSILLDSRERRDYFKAFYVRRAVRILPLYYAVLVLISLATVWSGHIAYQNMVSHWGSPWWFFIYLGNIPTSLTGHEPLGGGGVFIPLWSLQVEEQFYLLFPFLVHRLSLTNITRVLLGLCCFSTILRLLLYYRYPGNGMIQYVFLPCRMEGLALGAWIATRFRQGEWNINKRKLSGITLLAGIVAVGSVAAGGFFYTTPFNRTFGLLLSPLFCACLLLWIIVFRGTRASSCLRNPALAYLGKISYAAYLIHWPVGNIVALFIARINQPFLNAGGTRLVLIYALTFGLSAVSWHFFEKPCLRFKDKLFPPGRMARLT